VTECKPLQSGVRFGPPGSRRLVYFFDDMNMPYVDKYDTQSPIELARQNVDYHGQGLTLVHITAQPGPFLVTEATAGVHFIPQLQTLPMRPLIIAHQKCSRQAEKRTSVVHKTYLR
jgi:hypothetical protein